MLKWLFCFLFFSIACFSALAQETYTLSLTVRGLQSKKGHIAVAVYSSENKEAFPRNGEKAFKQSYVVNENKDGEQEILIEGLPRGEYALAVFHDEDSDLKVLTGLFGMPKEGVAFSNNPKLIFGPPSFQKAKVSVDQNLQKLNVDIKYF